MPCWLPWHSVTSLDKLWRRVAERRRQKHANPVLHGRLVFNSARLDNVSANPT